MSREPFEEDRERVVDALWSDSSAECVEAVDGEGCLMLEISGALYESMLVVESNSTGMEIFDLSICGPGFLILWERFGDVGDGSDLFIRLVTARARDMVGH